MSIVITMDVFCDGVLADGHPCPAWVHGRTAGGTGPRRAAARDEARQLRGWRCVERRGRAPTDYCPGCWERRRAFNPA